MRLYCSTVYKWGPLIIAAAAGLFVVVERIDKMAAIWTRARDWKRGRLDGQVLRFMKNAEEKLKAEGKVHTRAGFILDGIAQGTGRSTESVLKSLERLEDEGRVHSLMDAWWLGPKGANAQRFGSRF